MYAGQQTAAGYANAIGSAISTAPMSASEIPNLLDMVSQRAAELEKSLTVLVERLQPVMRHDKTAEMPVQAPRAVANTQVGGRLDDIDRQLSFLRDSVGTVLGRLEV